ncbi:hypothetical protein GGR57DRAFT_500533 [Xylariaceae sp. FL1272]|nr:hypothetical protein GGR57DRAFT_500533 [Xylariaceae sp. FL1272]
MRVTKAKEPSTRGSGRYGEDNEYSIIPLDFIRPVIDEDGVHEIFTFDLKWWVVHYFHGEKRDGFYNSAVLDTELQRGVEDLKVEDLKNKSLNIVTFLCGGPGATNEPLANTEMNRWLLAKGFIVLYGNYRATDGSSFNTEIDSRMLQQMHNEVAQAEVAQVFNHSRVLDIAGDIESVRLCLLEDNKWDILGQSLGSFIGTSVYSWFPAGLKGLYLTGCLPPVKNDPKTVYENLFKVVVAANESYYAQHGKDKENVKKIVKWLLKKEINKGTPLDARWTRLKAFKPNYDPNDSNADSTGELTARRFLCLGRCLGKDAQCKKLNAMIERFANEIDEIDDDTADRTGPSQEVLDMYHQIDTWKIYKREFYPLLHEMQYSSFEGPEWKTCWAASEVAKKPLFNQKYWWVGCDDPRGLLDRLNKEDPEELYFSGEMVFPFFFKVYKDLKRYAPVAEILAQMEPTRDMYDLKMFKESDVPVKALSYKNDMYVEHEHSKETAELFRTKAVVGRPPNMTFIAKDVIAKDGAKWEHAAIRTRTIDVLEELFGKITEEESRRQLVREEGVLRVKN